jgi:hypothetical protein
MSGAPHPERRSVAPSRREQGGAVIDLHGRLDLVRCTGCSADHTSCRLSERSGASKCGMDRPRRLGAARRRCRPRSPGLFRVRRAGLRIVRRHPEAGCGFLWRERSTRSGGRRAGSPRRVRRHARRRLVADGLFRFPVRPDGSASRNSDSSCQSGSDPSRRSSGIEGQGPLRGRTCVPTLICLSSCKALVANRSANKRLGTQDNRASL